MKKADHIRPDPLVIIANLIQRVNVKIEDAELF